jgi:hypothetical protein
MNVYKSSVVATGFVVGGWIVLRLKGWLFLLFVAKKYMHKEQDKNGRWEMVDR